MEGNGLRVNLDKTKGIELLFGKKISVMKVDLCSVCGERVGFNSIQMCSDVPRKVSLVPCNVFVCRTCLCHNCSVEEKLEFKRGKDILKVLKKFFLSG